jgi:FHA domain
VTDHGVLPGLWPIQGDGVLARQGDLVLLIHPAGGAFTDRLLDLLTEAAGAGESGIGFVDRISAEFDADAAAAEAAGHEHGPAAVAFGPAGRGTAAIVYGTAWADVTTAHGKQRMTTGQPYGRLRCVLPSKLVEVRAGVQEAEGQSDTDPYLRLAEGVVRAVGLVYAPEGTRAETADVAKPEPSGRLTPLDVPQAAPPIPAPPIPAPPIPAPPIPAAPIPAASAPAPPIPAASAPAQAAPPPPAPGPPTALGVAQVAPQAPPPPPPAPPTPPRPPTSLDVAQVAPPAPPPPAPASAPPAPPVPPAPAPRLPTSLDAAYTELQAPGPAAEPDVSAKPDFISLSFGGELAAADLAPRTPLPLGAEPPDEKDLGAADKPAPLVEGIYCKNGHFNDPEARYCAVCGIGMAQLTKIRKKDKRPPLGVLVLPDGSVCQLDADYVMGREPTLDASVANGSARPLRLPSAGGVVSRIHARVDLDGWQVYISDLNSANGTQVVQPGETAGTALQPGVRTPLAAGAQIRLGGEYGLRYDSHRHR